MKKMSKFTTLLSAAIISVSVCGMSAYAAPAYGENPCCDSWVLNECDWEYIMPDGTYAAGGLYKIDGVLYKFNDDGKQVGKYTGWTKSNGVRRRYSKGLPYTGWLKCNDGLDKRYRYCLDGYITSEDIQIDDYIYSFTKDGYYTDRTRCGLYAHCSRYVTEDVQNINVTVENLDRYDDCNFGVISRMERWENGKWVNCYEEWVGENGEELVYPDIGYMLSNGETMELGFEPQLYTNYNFTPGYYRMPIDYWTDNLKDKMYTYANFEVLPKAELNIPEADMSGSRVFVNLDINSQEIEYDIVNDIDFKLYKMTENGWKSSDSSKDIIIAAEATEEEYAYGFRTVFFETYINDGAGYYKAVVTINGEEYEKKFRLNTLYAKAKKEVYSLDEDRLRIEFEIFNPTDKPVEITPGIFGIWEKKNGKWVDPEYARIAHAECEIGSLVIDAGESHTELFDDVFYDIDLLKAGEYAVLIDYCGYVTFELK